MLYDLALMAHVSLDLLLTIGGHAVDLVHWRQKRRAARPEYKLFQFEGGIGATLVDDFRHAHQPGELVLIPAHRHIQHHSAGPISLGWIHFRPLSPHFDAMLAHLDRPVVLGHATEPIIPWSGLQALIHGPDPLPRYQIQATVAGLALDAICQVFGPSGPQDQPDPQLATVRRHIERSYLDRPSLQDLADLVGWSSGYLQKRFKRCYGQTPHDTVQDHLMADVLEALRSEPASLEQIAEELGFTDRFHLSKAISRHFGQTASELRSGRGVAP